MTTTFLTRVASHSKQNSAHRRIVQKLCSTPILAYGSHSRRQDGNNQYVTVGDTNGVGNILISPDGKRWIPIKILPSHGGRIANVVYGDGRFVAIGNNGGLVYTFSAVAPLTRSSIPGGNIISYVNGLFIVPLNNKTNLVSTDGIAWDANATGLTNTIGRVTHSHELFMALCGIPELAGHLATTGAQM